MTLKRTVKGRRPAFHENAAVDRLIAMMMAMASELSTLRDRIETLEALGADAGWLQPGAVDAYAPDTPERARRDASREAMLARLFYVLEEELDDITHGETDDTYKAAIARIARA